MRIVWVKTELLHPLDKGGRIRTYQMLRQLVRHHHVKYLCLDDGSHSSDARARASEYCHELVCVDHFTNPKFSLSFYREAIANVFCSVPYFIQKYISAELRQRITDDATRCDLMICDFLHPAVNLPPHLPCPAVLFQHNVEAMIWKRHYQVQTNPMKKAYLWDQWRKAFRFERAACQQFDGIVAVSPEDREVMRREYGVTEVADVPTGVDANYFRPSGERPGQPHTLIFTGSMDWLPNDEAVRFFVDKIFPAIRTAIPDVRLLVVGRNPYPGLIDLASRDPSIVVTGTVPDVRPYMHQAAVYVVPIRVGGGTRLKIYEAMAMEKPIVSTTVGAEGLPVQDGKHLLVADDPDAFAKAVLRLLADPGLAEEMGRCAGRLVTQHFSWEKVTDRFLEACGSAQERWMGKNRGLREPVLVDQ